MNRLWVDFWAWVAVSIPKKVKPLVARRRATMPLFWRS